MSVTGIYGYVSCEINVFFFYIFVNHLRKIHRGVARKVKIDLLYFQDVYDVNL